MHLSPLHAGLRLHQRTPPWSLFCNTFQEYPSLSCSFISLSTVLLRVSLGLPLFLQPSDVHLSATLVRDVVGIRSTCPIHFHTHIFTSMVIGHRQFVSPELGVKCVAVQKLRFQERSRTLTSIQEHLRALKIKY